MTFLFWLICSGIDYFDIGGDPNAWDFFRMGKIRYAIFAACVVAAWKLRGALTWPVSLFLSWTVLRWCLENYPSSGVIYIICVPVAVYLGHTFARLGHTKFENMLILVGCFEAAWGLFQAFGHPLLYKIMDANMQGVALGNMGHATMLGPFLAACLAPALWRGRYAASALMILAILYTKSSMSLASLVAVLGVFFWYKHGFFRAINVGFVLIAAGIGVFLLYPNLEIWSFTGRPPIWEHAIKGIAHRPVFGGGPGYWAADWVKRVNPNMGALSGTVSALIPDHVHNEYLEFIVEYGLFGAIFMVAAMVQFIIRFKPSWPNAVCAAIMVNALANFPLHIMPLGIIFVACWLLTSKEGDKHGTSKAVVFEQNNSC